MFKISAGAIYTYSLGFRDCGNEDNEVAGAKVVVEEHDGVGLCLCRLDPLEEWLQHAHVIATFSKSYATVATYSDTLILQKRERESMSVCRRERDFLFRLSIKKD